MWKAGTLVIFKNIFLNKVRHDQQRSLDPIGWTCGIGDTGPMREQICSSRIYVYINKYIYIYMYIIYIYILYEYNLLPFVSWYL
jgi:hypothetical protein